jgi:hypothetical protein
MTDNDKYGIQAKLQEIIDAPETRYMLESRPDLIVSAIWEEVYPLMPLCEPEDSSIFTIIELLKKKCDTIKVEESCGLFSVMKVTLPNNVCYLHKCQGSYYILPMYKNVRRFYTRLEPEVAVDLILEFDRCAPIILRAIEDKKLEITQKALTIQLMRATILGIIESLKAQGRIKVPDRVVVNGASPKRISVCFMSNPVIHCKLEDLEARLIEKYGTDKQ